MKSQVKNKWILLTYERNKFQNIQLSNLETSQTFVVEKAHQKHITGVAMFNDGCFFSSSLDSETPIKMWQLEGDQFKINLENTKLMNSQVNNPKVEINFLKTIEFGGSVCICAGTNDGKIFLWKDGQFVTIEIPQTHEAKAVFVMSIFI